MGCLIEATLAQLPTQHAREARRLEFTSTLRERIVPFVDRALANDADNSLLIDVDGDLVRGFAWIEVLACLELGVFANVSAYRLDGLDGGYAAGVDALLAYCRTREVDALSISVDRADQAKVDELIHRDFYYFNEVVYDLDAHGFKSFRLERAAPSLPEGYVFRWAGVADLPALISLMQSFLDSHGVVRSQQHMERTLRRKVTQPRSRGGLLVMCNGEQIEAVTALDFQHEFVAGRRCAISDYVVRPDARGQKLGMQLFVEVIRLARREGIPMLMGYVSPANPGATAFWNRMAVRRPGTMVSCFRMLGSG